MLKNNIKSRIIIAGPGEGGEGEAVNLAGFPSCPAATAASCSCSSAESLTASAYPALRVSLTFAMKDKLILDLNNGYLHIIVSVASL